MPDRWHITCGRQKHKKNKEVGVEQQEIGSESHGLAAGTVLTTRVVRIKLVTTSIVFA
jgi:hypothetical protein